MDSPVNRHLRDLYGLNPSIPHLAFQFPRLPPGLAHPMFKIYENPMKEQFSDEMDTMSQKLQGFQHLYQQHASGLLTMNSSIIPPGHPLYNRKSSAKGLQAENDKLLKENTELKKKLDKKSKSN
jgi:hypothetical protein